jgi:MFS family permease
MPSALALLSRHFPLTGIVAGIGLFVLAPVTWFLVIAFPPPKLAASASANGRLFLFKQPVFLLAGLALAIQSGMEGMSNDWITRYFKKVTLGGEHAAEWKTLLGLMAVTGAMVAARIVLSGLLKHVSSRLVLFASIGLTASGALALMWAGNYFVALAAALLIGAGLAAGFPIVLSYIGDLYPLQSGTAFSTIFFIALVGNMTINKGFGLLAQIHGIQQYTKVMLGCLAASALLLFLVVRQLPISALKPAAARDALPPEGVINPSVQ